MTSDERNLPNDGEEDRVDLTLIRWMLWLTPSERLQFMEQERIWLQPQTDAQKLAIMRRTLEEKQKGPFWPQRRVQ